MGINAETSGVILHNLHIRHKRGLFVKTNKTRLFFATYLTLNLAFMNDNPTVGQTDGGNIFSAFALTDIV